MHIYENSKKFSTFQLKQFSDYNYNNRINRDITQSLYYKQAVRTYNYESKDPNLEGSVRIAHRHDPLSDADDRG